MRRPDELPPPVPTPDDGKTPDQAVEDRLRADLAAAVNSVFERHVSSGVVNGAGGVLQISRGDATLSNLLFAHGSWGDPDERHTETRRRQGIVRGIFADSGWHAEFRSEIVDGGFSMTARADRGESTVWTIELTPLKD